MTPPPHRPARRRRAAAALAALVPLALAAQVPPPAPPSPDQPVVLEQLVVTGTNILRVEQERALPVTVIRRDAMELRDASSAVEMLMASPQVVNVPLNETATLGATARGDNASISLRGIPTANTLVLLNGRRLAPHPISAAEGSVPALSPNVNQLPSRGIDRIEVLRDGASSIYGTDAVAGVVNYITDRDFRGAELRLRYGLPERPGGEEYRATALYGFDGLGGRFRFVTTLDYFQREAIFARDRPNSAESDLTYLAPPPWNDVNADADFFFRSATSAFGNFNIGTPASVPGSFTGGRPAGISTALATATGAFFLIPTTATASGVGFKTTTPLRTGVERDYYYNNNLNRNIQPESRRWNWFATADYDLTDRITAFTELGFYQARSTVTREPDSASNATDGDIIVPATNPWNPFGTRFLDPAGTPNADGSPRIRATPAPVRIQNRRFLDFGLRSTTVDSQVYRALGGVRGRLGASWNWESAVYYTHARTRDNEAGATRQSLFQSALNQTDPARAYNPFGYNFAVSGTNSIVVTGPAVNPRSVIETFQQDFLREGTTSILSWDARASGELVRIWGGNTIAGAAGLEWRHETYTDFRPPFAGLNPAGSGLNPLDNDFLAFSPNADTDGDRDVQAVFVEFAIPLIGGTFKPFEFQSLELNLSARHERYSDFGNTTKPKAGFTFRPSDWLMFRGSYNEGFRAPNLAQLFTTELQRSTAITDGYRNVVTSLPADGSVFRIVRRSGNLDLTPEESTGKTLGVVVDVPRVTGLTFSFDYWRIEQKDVIAVAGSVTEDRDALIAETQRQLAAGVPIASIDLGSGTAGYRGDPGVVRRAVTQADRDFFTAYNATRAPADQRAVVGSIDFVREKFFNRARAYVSGWDFDATYELPWHDFGRFTLSTEWSHLLKSYTVDTPGAPDNNRRWEAGTPKWKGSGSIIWRDGPWRLGLSAYYTGSFTDADGSTTETVYNQLGQPSYIGVIFDTGAFRYRYIVQSYTTYNAFASYRFRSSHSWLGDTTMRVGVNNLADTLPPLAADSRGYTTSVYTSEMRGRTLTVELTRRF